MNDQRKELETLLKGIEEAVNSQGEDEYVVVMADDDDPLLDEAEDIAEAWGKTFPPNRFNTARLDSGELVGTLTVLPQEVVEFVYGLLKIERGVQ